MDFDASLKQDIEAEKQASQKMDEDSALEEAASAGPDVSARVCTTLRYCTAECKVDSCVLVIGY